MPSPQCPGQYRHYAKTSNHFQIFPHIGAALPLLLRRRVLLPQQIVVNIRPKFLQLIAEGVDTHLHAPAVRAVPETPVAGGIIDGRDSNCRRIARELGDVKHSTTGIFTSDQNTTECIEKTVTSRAS